MNHQKRFLVGVLAGSVSGLIFALLVLVVTWIVWSTSAENKEFNSTVWVILLIGPVSGAIVGTMNARLDRTFEATELSVLCFLLCVALASASVVLIGVSSQPLLPLAVYGLATLNGTLILPAVRLISRQAMRPMNRYNGKLSQ